MNLGFLASPIAARCGLAACAIVLALAIGVPIAMAFQAQQDNIDDALQQWGTAGAEIATRAALESQLSSLNRRGASVPGIVEGGGTALAQARLQGDIKNIVEAAKGEVRSMQALPANQRGAFEVIAIQCDLAIPQTRIKDLTYAIAAHAPYLFVDQATIASPPSNPDDPADRDVVLDVRWTIHGYRWAGRR
ncbi:MAG: hypothetical protein JO261_07595 [Alphaproteobacteria bacterium]|nr:hypothetical protein [Alphaproteobacteria bacterium]MBV9693546.1 hypothetical protein [Alphaproteobacteria bacterium]